MTRKQTGKGFQQSKVLGREAPKFSLGDAVLFKYAQHEDEHVYVDRGVITGIVLNPPGTREEGWWYQIFFYASDHPDRLDLQHTEFYFHEEDLELDEGVRVHLVG